MLSFLRTHHQTVLSTNFFLASEQLKMAAEQRRRPGCVHAYQNPGNGDGHSIEMLMIINCTSQAIGLRQGS
jgi:hypothetical protein